MALQNDASVWEAKYLALLQQHEALKARFDPSGKVLRRTLAKEEHAASNNGSTEQASQVIAGHAQAAGPTGKVPPDFTNIDYSVLAEHIQSILNKALNELPTRIQNSKQVTELRKRVNHDFRWYKLPPLLGDMFAFIRAQHLYSEHGLEHYLLQLNQHLAQFNDNLHSTAKITVSPLRTPKAWTATYANR